MRLFKAGSLVLLALASAANEQGTSGSNITSPVLSGASQTSNTSVVSSRASSALNSAQNQSSSETGNYTTFISLGTPLVTIPLNSTSRSANFTSLVSLGTPLTTRIANGTSSYETVISLGTPLLTSGVNSTSSYETVISLGTPLLTSGVNGTSSYETVISLGTPLTSQIANGTSSYETVISLGTPLTTQIANGTSSFETVISLGTPLLTSGASGIVGTPLFSVPSQNGTSTTLLGTPLTTGGPSNESASYTTVVSLGTPLLAPTNSSSTGGAEPTSLQSTAAVVNGSSSYKPVLSLGTPVLESTAGNRTATTKLGTPLTTGGPNGTSAFETTVSLGTPVVTTPFLNATSTTRLGTPLTTAAWVKNGTSSYETIITLGTPLLSTPATQSGPFETTIYGTGTITQTVVECCDNTCSSHPATTVVTAPPSSPVTIAISPTSYVTTESLSTVTVESQCYSTIPSPPATSTLAGNHTVLVSLQTVSNTHTLTQTVTECCNHSCSAHVASTIVTAASTPVTIAVSPTSYVTTISSRIVTVESNCYSTLGTSSRPSGVEPSAPRTAQQGVSSVPATLPTTNAVIGSTAFSNHSQSYATVYSKHTFTQTVTECHDHSCGTHPETTEVTGARSSPVTVAVVPTSYVTVISSQTVTVQSQCYSTVSGGSTGPANSGAYTHANATAVPTPEVSASVVTFLSTLSTLTPSDTAQGISPSVPGVSNSTPLVITGNTVVTASLCHNGACTPTAVEVTNSGSTPIYGSPKTYTTVSGSVTVTVHTFSVGPQPVPPEGSPSYVVSTYLSTLQGQPTSLLPQTPPALEPESSYFGPSPSGQSPPVIASSGYASGGQAPPSLQSAPGVAGSVAGGPSVLPNRSTRIHLSLWTLLASVCVFFI